MGTGYSHLLNRTVDFQFIKIGKLEIQHKSDGKVVIFYKIFYMPGFLSL